jgi:hypothetical protein
MGAGRSTPPATTILRRQRPAIHYKRKRGVTLEQHQKLLAAEVIPEAKNASAC